MSKNGEISPGRKKLSSCKSQGRPVILYLRQGNSWKNSWECPTQLTTRQIQPPNHHPGVFGESLSWPSFGLERKGEQATYGGFCQLSTC